MGTRPAYSPVVLKVELGSQHDMRMMGEDLSVAESKGKEGNKTEKKSKMCHMDSSEP